MQFDTFTLPPRSCDDLSKVNRKLINAIYAATNPPLYTAISKAENVMLVLGGGVARWGWHVENFLYFFGNKLKDVRGGVVVKSRHGIVNAGGSVKFASRPSKERHPENAISHPSPTFIHHSMDGNPLTPRASAAADKFVM